MSKAMEQLGSPKSAVELYYWRIDRYFDAIGDFNKVRPVYENLGGWMPPKVAYVFNNKFHGNSAAVIDTYKKRERRINTAWNLIIESCIELGVRYSDQDVREFRSLARSTQSETKFRKSVGGRITRQYADVKKEMAKRRMGDDPNPIHPESLRELIAWYQR